MRNRVSNGATVPELPPTTTPTHEDLTAALRDLIAVLRRDRGVTPELLQARDAARLAGVSTASWHRLVAAGMAPAPVRLAGSVRWRVAELRQWIVAGCPARGGRQE